MLTVLIYDFIEVMFVPVKVDREANAEFASCLVLEVAELGSVDGYLIRPWNRVEVPHGTHKFSH